MLLIHLPREISSFFSKELNDNVKQINNSDYKNIQRLENEIEKEIWTCKRG
jgi:hypothetical protein